MPRKRSQQSHPMQFTASEQRQSFMDHTTQFARQEPITAPRNPALIATHGLRTKGNQISDWLQNHPYKKEIIALACGPPKGSSHEGHLQDIENHNREMLKDHPYQKKLLAIAVAQRAIIDADEAKKPKTHDPEMMEIRECAMAQRYTPAELAQLQEQEYIEPDQHEAAKRAKAQQEAVDWKDECLQHDLWFALQVLQYQMEEDEKKKRHEDREKMDYDTESSSTHECG